MRRAAAPAHPLPPELARLDLVGRLILTCDGTVTPLVEQVVGERIVTARLAHVPAPPAEDVAELLAPTAGPLLSRTTHLVGAGSGRVYVRAATVMAVGALPAPLRADLLGSEEPIGRLLRRHRVESFREILSYSVPAGAGAARRYRVFAGGVPVMLIDEHFAPESLRAGG
ncbi:chorismate pyruvate-lyase family protein [Kitasatospora sp. CM 4170]|uniref:Chorismate pyruvate-lyase family protein n=1 Tax=Kitasatospora aburaviensis TaxID=67265 RepID=A0ABW1ERH2_9ACTN|nr:chorismate pyruvate-lyase family protein [Kitasatospora sp. CM 4170]WNM44679.1 chorismate pyruvate-lyase family protein [Kitasatospora sp. CM 4170]